MPSASATVNVHATAATVYAYLESRYDSETHRSASLACKGYVPAVRCLEAIADRRLVFMVPGRDPLTRLFIGSWTWSYDIEPTGTGASRVTITYSWNWWMSFLCAGTTYHQACNEITETAMALDALGWSGTERAAVAAEKTGSSQQIVDIRSGQPAATGIRAEHGAAADRPRDGR